MPQSESINKAIYYPEVLEYFGLSMYLFRKRLKQSPKFSHLLIVKKRSYFSPSEFDFLKEEFWKYETKDTEK